MCCEALVADVTGWCGADVRSTYTQLSFDTTPRCQSANTTQNMTGIALDQGTTLTERWTSPEALDISR